MRILVIFFLLIPFLVFGENKYGRIKGTIFEINAEIALKDVLVQIQGEKILARSDSLGRFALNDLLPGKYYLVFLKKGYYALVLPEVEVKAGQDTDLIVKMYPGNEQEFLFLEIGGIQVTAERGGLPEKPETTYLVTAGEIEHMQATNLADILDIIPGNEKATHLGLQRKQQINLRHLGEQSLAFGTKIILDDVPLSNNVDLQTGAGVNYGVKVQNTAETEYDLREIVAENLQQVEVQPGATSVEYGDLTTGLIIATTRTRNVPTRIKLKNNPDTKEANLMGSFKKWSTNFVYNFNYGYSERDIRVKGDEFHRIAVNLKSENQFFKNQLKLFQGLRFVRKIEEDNDQSDPNKTRAYNRDFHLTYSQRIYWNRSPNATWYLRTFLDYKHRNSWKRKLENRDLGYATNLLEPGTIEGIFADPIYFSDVRTRGDEWAVGLKIKFLKRLKAKTFTHRILAGSEYQKEWNNGPGKQFDLLFPPNGNGHVRPRSFNEIPGIAQLSFFVEDQVVLKHPVQSIVSLGFRLDSYNPIKFSALNPFRLKDVLEARQGTFFNPRLGIKIKLTSESQLRITFSKASKAPALSQIYPEKFYLDVNDLGYQHQLLSDGRDSTIIIPLISTYVYDRTNRNLKGAQSTKFEIGLDFQVGKFSLSLNAFYQKTRNIPAPINYPLNYNRYQWEKWPAAEPVNILEKVTLASSGYSIFKNAAWNNSSGLEFFVKSYRLPRLNLRFWTNMAYLFSRSGLKNSTPIFSAISRNYRSGDTLTTGWIVPEDMQIVPYYRPTTSWNQKVIINYKIDYTAKKLGLWLTLKAQQILWDRVLKTGNPSSHAIGYYLDGQLIPIDAQTSTLMNLDRSFNPLLTTVDNSRPNDKWLFSVIVSRSVFKGAEVSLFVENIFNDRAYYRTKWNTYSARNPEMFWGVAFSSKLDVLFKH
ncbi:MAG: TonB-dependent receptor [Calditrichaeota bacterium]|nr:MAG: TonB-dependent receptor [Calditrichota bacterium]